MHGTCIIEYDKIRKKYAAGKDNNRHDKWSV